jgi:hypothetical protein
MTWDEIRIHYPNQWIVAEATLAYTNEAGERIVRDLLIAEICENGSSAFQAYRKHHSSNPEREFFYLHTSRKELGIIEERWLGIRIPVAVHA